MKAATKKRFQASVATYLSCTLMLLLWQFIVLSVISKYKETQQNDDRYLKNWSGDAALIPKPQHEGTYGDQKSSDFAEGSLNVAPTLHRQCVTIRFRGDNNNYTVDDAAGVLVNRYKSSPGPRRLRMGIMLMEDAKTFLPVRIRSHGNQYHLFHFVELLVIAYTELHRLSSTLPMHAGYNLATIHSSIPPTSLSKGSPSITVPWIFSPYMSPLEICGGSNEINCLIADLVLQGSNRSIFQNRTGIIGLNAMEKYPFDYKNDKMKAIDYRMELASYVYGESPSFADEADGVILVERFGCNMGGINKPWSKYIDKFPAYSWHSDVHYGLGRSSNYGRNTSNEKGSRQKLVIGYIDRQNTDRRLPEEHHNWILQYGLLHSKIIFRQLHMESYAAHKQIALASECDMLIGMHGNGLTHALWMQPKRYVIEFFWKYNYQFDYSTVAHLMNHSYLGLLNGKVVDPVLVQNRDASLRGNPSRKEAQHAPIQESMDAFEQEGKVAIQEFIEKAIRELRLA
jgi:hypothetical protein